MAAPSTHVKNFVGGSVTLSDGTGTPLTLVVPLDQGNFSVSGLREYLNEPVKVETRGKFKSLLYGNRAYPQFSLSAYVGNLVGDDNVAPGSVLEMVTGTGAYSSAVSTLGASRNMTVDVMLTVEGTNWGDSADETITLEDVVISIDFAESGEGNTITMSGEVLGAVIIDNDSNTVTLDEV